MLDSSAQEKRMRLECLGRAPELISYMAMSIRLSPSLTRAITFAAKNMDDPISSGLKRILWNVYTRKYHSVEESFNATATGWGKWNEDLKRALFAVRSSSMETTEEGLERSLDKATDIVITGTKKKMEEFASSLSTPTTVLFALGILLPMSLGAMLPMISLGDLDLSHQASGLGQTEPSGGIQPFLIVVVMDVVFPLAALSYAMSILGKRPGIGSSVRIEDESRGRRRSFILSLALGLALATIGILTFNGFGAYVLIMSISLPTSVYLLTTTQKRRKERQEILRMEREFPDALFQLGTRIAEGSPPERAILETAKSMKDAKIAELFHKVYYRTIVFGLTLENALFGDNGLMRGFPSRTIEATMKSFVEVVKKDSVSAGQMMIKTSEYLKDLQRLEEDTKRRLRGSVESMKMTSLFFAPVVMGVTFSLYALLVDTFSQVGSAGTMMSPSVFLIVLGVYLLLMAAIAMFFVSTIEKGTDNVENGYSIGVGVVVATGIFTISCMIGQFTMA